MKWLKRKGQVYTDCLCDCGEDLLQAERPFYLRGTGFISYTRGVDEDARSYEEALESSYSPEYDDDIENDEHEDVCCSSCGMELGEAFVTHVLRKRWELAEGIIPQPPEPGVDLTQADIDLGDLGELEIPE